MIWLKIGITGNDPVPCLPDEGTPGPGPDDSPSPDEKPPPTPPDDKPPEQ